MQTKGMGNESDDESDDEVLPSASSRKRKAGKAQAGQRKKRKVATK